MPSAITLRFLGHSGWEIVHGQHTILIDPFLTGNPRAGAKPEDLNPSHIILTHAHGDHLGDAVDIAKRSGAHIISTFEVGEYLGEQGCEKVSGMGIGGAAQFEFGRVKFTIAHHSSSFPDGRYGGNPAGVLLMIDGRTIYHAGDTALFMDMKLIGERHPIDVALLPIGDYFTMGVDDAAYAVGLLKPKVAIPMHYDTFPPIKVDAGEFRRQVEEQGVGCVVMNPGETHTL